MFTKFPNIRQTGKNDCGITCLSIILKYYKISITPLNLKSYLNLHNNEVSLLELSNYAVKMNFKSLIVSISINELRAKVPLPIILHWKNNHYVVLYKISKNKYFISDPAFGLIDYNQSEFEAAFLDKYGKGNALVLEPDEKVNIDIIFNKELAENSGFTHYYKYFYKYKKYLLQAFLTLIISNIISISFPFLTQLLVDKGIGNSDYSLIYLLMIGQICFFIGQNLFDFLRNWLFLHINSRLNFDFLSDFIKTILNMSVSFFESRRIGDILQRFSDHDRMRNFLFSTLINSPFLVINFLVLSLLLIYYNITIFFVFLVSAIFSFVWSILFLRKRKEVDYKNFDLSSKNQDIKLQMLNGIQEIKLYGLETSKMLDWQSHQVKLFKLSITSMALIQLQNTGISFANGIRNILIIFISAKLVVSGEMTLGMMMAIQYIVGQLTSPINSFLSFVRSNQDARISLNRILEIHQGVRDSNTHLNQIKVFRNQDLGVEFKNVSFGYSENKLVLKDINFFIRSGQKIALVGESGSGKTTILKLLLKFYEPLSGEILINGISLKQIDTSSWREYCGCVLQDSFIFDDTILNNIVMSDREYNYDMVFQATKLACIFDDIQKTPMGYQTRLGKEGINLSGGQNQRILLSRLFYRNPNFLLFDEATSSLDNLVENRVMLNLKNYFQNRTILFASHKLSTIINSDQIIVLEKGEIVEIGHHLELMDFQGKYFKLFSKQFN